MSKPKIIKDIKELYTQLGLSNKKVNNKRENDTTPPSTPEVTIQHDVPDNTCTEQAIQIV